MLAHVDQYCEVESLEFCADSSHVFNGCLDSKGAWNMQDNSNERSTFISKEIFRVFNHPINAAQLFAWTLALSGVHCFGIFNALGGFGVFVLSPWNIGTIFTDLFVALSASYVSGAVVGLLAAFRSNIVSDQERRTVRQIDNQFHLETRIFIWLARMAGFVGLYTPRLIYIVMFLGAGFFIFWFVKNRKSSKQKVAKISPQVLAEDESQSEKGDAHRIIEYLLFPALFFVTLFVFALGMERINHLSTDKGREFLVYKNSEAHFAKIIFYLNDGLIILTCNANSYEFVPQHAISRIARMEERSSASDDICK